MTNAGRIPWAPEVMDRVVETLSTRPAATDAPINGLLRMQQAIAENA
ncbi:hypothetical protein G1H11_14270 [Phytoactinopolyspora alkaliphila]|uniref:Uncharacterized protein n=1 Tax=Phytoactinopolyspora alkaliphila TaxID=1783498 RepID=A0A6N9YNB9_9ACTN|nr:hypothetical protein [Phytoactinopolyspora alkaliphila]NED96472.1 hypothetical protein [Phytoactinopolyspora alkaliphila]